MTMTTNDLARTLSPAAQALIDGPTNWIDGTWEDGDADTRLNIVNPSTTEEIRTVANATTSQAERAVASARRAFDLGPWKDATPRERSEVILQIADIMDRHREELAEIIACPFEVR